MRRTCLLAVVAATLAATVPSAHAAPPVAGVDTTCSAESGPDPTAPPDVYVANLHGGPIGQSGALRCSIHINAPHHNHPSAVDASASSTSGSTTVPNKVVGFLYRQGDDAHICTEFVDMTGITYYYDGIASAWVTSAGVPCETLTVGTIAAPSPTPAAASATMMWSATPTSVTPTFTPPSGATPSTWSCTTSFPALGQARAVCDPAPGQPQPPGTVGWGCYVPYAAVHVQDQALSPGGSVTGVTSCGTGSVGCTATTSPTSPAAACADRVYAPKFVPVTCDAFYGSAAPGATWTVRCGPLGP